MAAATAALLALFGSNASALSLGRITVQSALGEALRAEIDIPEINAEESASLKTGVASADAFRAAGLEFNPAMAGLQATLQRRPDGRAFIRLISNKSINDPFVDMILEASWASGRIVRDYTMLFDPPSLRQPLVVAPTQAQIPSPAATTRPSTATTALPSPVAPVQARAPETRKTPAKSLKTGSSTNEKTPIAGQITVKPGDTASKIAEITRPANVSLDQMLVALLRANPDAFVKDNINRVKTGSVMNVPTAEQATAIPSTEASKIVIAHSKDFNDFRRKLAGSAPTTPVATVDRKASGVVQAKVEDKKPVAAIPDKLTLSKGSIQGKQTEEQLAKEKSAKEAASRSAELTKNISDLSKLSTVSASPPASTAASAVPVAKAASSVTVTALPVAAASTAVSSPASAAVPASTPAVAPKPVAPAVKRPLTVQAPLPEPSFIDGLIENPWVPAGAVGLIALLAGIGLYRVRQRKLLSQGDSAFMESHLAPESFFGGTGGQSVDTNDHAATGSSMAYSPSQLDAVDDVDPVAEADVYLAYGRDLQAEEILKDALSSNPGRIAIHQKLLEIFAKRRDLKAFEEVASAAHKISQGNGQEWARICELGQNIDPNHLLYQPGGRPNQPATSSFYPSSPTAHEFAAESDNTVDLDLDLDFSLDEEESDAVAAPHFSPAKPEVSRPAEAPPYTSELNMDFGLTTEAVEPFAGYQEPTSSNTIEFSLPELDFDMDAPSEKRNEVHNGDYSQPHNSNVESADVTPTEYSKTAEPTAPDLGMLTFDMGSLSLDLDEEPDTQSHLAGVEQEDSLATKLALAEEFRTIGDDDGARALIEEVIAEASGDMRAKAQRALSYL